MRTLTLRAFTTVLFASSIAACGGGDPAAATGDTSAADDGKEDSAGSLPKAACAQQHVGKTHDGDSVVICDALYPERAYVRPPVDKIVSGGTSTLYVAVVNNLGGFYLVDRDGAEYTPVDASGKPLSGASSTGIPKAMHQPSNRTMYLLYEVTGTVGKPTGTPARPTIHLATGKAIILLPGALIDGAFPTWEGTASKRVADGRWDDTQTVPVRVRFDHTAALGKLSTWSSTPPLPDGDVFTATGTVENMTAGVKAADGTCIPSLGSYGSASPFYGATSDTLSLFRMGAMHFPGDQETVVTYPSTPGLAITGMGGVKALHPANFLATKDLPEFTSYTFYPHGAPSGHVMTLHPVMGGGGACK